MRDVGRADVLAVGERREPLYVNAEEARERPRLRLAQLGERPGHLVDRAVALAQLEGRPAGDRSGAGGVAVGTERLGEHLRP